MRVANRTCYQTRDLRVPAGKTFQPHGYHTLTVDYAGSKASAWLDVEVAVQGLSECRVAGCDVCTGQPDQGRE